jgi:shikimate kinase
MIFEKKKIVLVGMTGVGKTTVGKILSKILRKKFIDIDYEIEKSSGLKIHDFFESYGEEQFRRVEKKVLEKILDVNENFIISTGAGVLEDIESLENIKKKAISIYLDIKISNLVDRLSSNIRNRPKLKTGNLKENLMGMYNLRQKNYNSADIKITVDGLSLPDIVKRIINKLQNHEKN